MLAYALKLFFEVVTSGFTNFHKNNPLVERRSESAGGKKKRGNEEGVGVCKLLGVQSWRWISSGRRNQQKRHQHGISRKADKWDYYGFRILYAGKRDQAGVQLCVGMEELRVLPMSAVRVGGGISVL